MAKMGKFRADDLKKFQKQLQNIQQNDISDFVEACAKELAARLLGKVIKRTPVGDYPGNSGKKGGTLRRGWTSGKKNAKASEYADSLPVRNENGMITVEIINPVEYASYVEYGHRTSNHKGWVSGRFMLTISESEIQDIAPKVLEARIKKLLERCMK